MQNFHKNAPFDKKKAKFDLIDNVITMLRNVTFEVSWSLSWILAISDERYCGMLIPLISSRKLPYVNLINNVLLQVRFKYLQFLPTYDEKVFSNFKEKEKTWPSHRVKSSIVYDNQYEFYSPCVNCKLTKNEPIKLKQCYAAIFQKNARDIKDIGESYMKYGKLRTKDGNIVSSKWWKKENDSSRNDYCINLTIDEQEEETFGQVEYFMLHNMQNQERMFAYI
ncbi:hypothetical protein GLOIN_2v1812804 [Rhizophagus irregularis DAOM 181602=DAOM 197198]|nr:hypothetical protein GLOIN_2v1812804 [Rhizophagus irregularis DAOM 181602=DAOM 197198]